MSSRTIAGESIPPSFAIGKLYQQMVRGFSCVAGSSESVITGTAIMETAIMEPSVSEGVKS